MTNKIKLATTDGKGVNEKSPFEMPQGAEPFQTYSLKDNLNRSEFAANWRAFFGRDERSKQLINNPPRQQRQLGKIEEAQKYGKQK